MYSQLYGTSIPSFEMLFWLARVLARQFWPFWVLVLGFFCQIPAVTNMFNQAYIPSCEQGFEKFPNLLQALISKL